MNVFALDNNPKLAASFHNDKHAIKMVLETAQILCTTLNLNGIESPYKTTHKNHPCSIWVRSSVDNFLWTIELGTYLAEEYTKRYGKIHKCLEVINHCFDHIPDLPDIGLTPFVLAMPDQYKSDDPVESYRAYYRGEKRDFAVWSSPAKVPEWWY